MKKRKSQNIGHISHLNDEYSIAMKKSIKLSKQAEIPETDVQRKKMAEAKRRHRDNMKKREDEILGNKHCVGNSVNEEIMSPGNETNQKFYSSLGNGNSGFFRSSDSLEDRSKILVLSTSTVSVNEIINEDESTGIELFLNSSKKLKVYLHWHRMMKIHYYSMT